MQVVEQGTVPHSWVSARVAVGLLDAGARINLSGVGGIRPVEAVYKSGVLEAVTDLGIVGEFAEGDEDTMRAYYPWSAVLVLTPIE